MLTIRLQRVGRKNDPSFRVIVTDSKKAAKTGSFIEVVGAYDARQGKPLLKTERITHWMEKGAKVSDTVHNLLVRMGVVKGTKVAVAPVIKPKEKAPEAAPAPVVEEAPAPEAPAETAETAPEETPTE